jgi:O-antigen ligase
MKKSNTRLVDVLIIWVLSTTTLGVTPFYSYDPINIIKFSMVIIFGAMSAGFVFLGYKEIFLRDYLPILILSIFFLIFISLAAAKSSMNLTESLYGVSGRLTGVLTYTSLLFLMLVAAIYNSKKNLHSITKLLILCGVISTFYGILQALGLDIIDWVSPYSKVFGFFGNPNFYSSFVAISGVAAFTYGLKKNLPSFQRTLYFSYLLTVILAISQSKSVQGYLVLLIGVSFSFFLWLRTQIKLIKFVSFYLFCCVIGLFLITIDMLQKSPWHSILYQPSVTFRGDFWRAGWDITKDNPIYGVGLDGYRDSYRFYRDQVTADRNPTAMVDSAHNIFLDISTGGGFPLLIIYCALLLLVIISIIKVTRREKVFNPNFAALSGAWLGYQAQSLISISHIGLAIWGWVLSGVIIGYEINCKKSDSNSEMNNPKSKGIAVPFGLVVGLVISLPLLGADGEFYSTLNSGDVIKIEQNLDQFPQSVTRMNLAAKIFVDSGFPERALVISKKAVKFNPRNFEAWEQIYLNPKSDENTKAQALAKMRELDPLNPNIK